MPGRVAFPSRRWLRLHPRSDGFPTLLFIPVVALLMFIGLRSVSLGTFDIPIYFVNGEPGYVEGSVRPTYLLNLHTDQPTRHEPGLFELRSNDQLLINARVPVNAIAWLDAGILMTFATDVSCNNHTYTFAELALKGWKTAINVDDFSSCYRML